MAPRSIADGCRFRRPEAVNQARDRWGLLRPSWDWRTPSVLNRPGASGERVSPELAAVRGWSDDCAPGRTRAAGRGPGRCAVRSGCSSGSRSASVARGRRRCGPSLRDGRISASSRSITDSASVFVVASPPVLIDAPAPASTSGAKHRIDVYWIPASLWSTTPSTDRPVSARIHNALSKGSPDATQ